MLEEHVKGLALGSVVLDNDARALDDLAGVALGIDLAETGPLAELHLVVNLCGGGTRNGHSTKRAREQEEEKRGGTKGLRAPRQEHPRRFGNLSRTQLLPLSGRVLLQTSKEVFEPTLRGRLNGSSRYTRRMRDTDGAPDTPHRHDTACVGRALRRKLRMWILHQCKTPAPFLKVACLGIFLVTRPLRP